MIDTKILRAIPVLGGLTEPELAAVASIIEVKRFHKGEMLFEKGDARDAFYILLSGEAHIYRLFNDEVQTLAILDPYNFVVENALHDTRAKHEHNGEMTITGDVALISGKKFQEFADAYPQIAKKILGNIITNLTERLHHSNNKLVTLYSTGKIASTYSDLDHLTTLLFDTILQIIAAKRGLFVFFHPEEGVAKVREARGYSNNQQMKNLAIRLFQDPIFGQMYQSKRAVIVSRETYKKQKALHTAYSSPSMLGVPLHVGARVVGAILLGDKADSRDFSYNNQVLLDIIARQIAIPIALAETEEQGAASGA